MKTLKTLLLSIVPAAVLALGSVMLSGCGQSEAARIVAVDDRSVTVETAAEGPKTHEVASDAKITLDGKPAELNDLQPGDKVKVEVTTNQEGSPEAPKEVAVVIDAKRAEEGPAASEAERSESGTNEPNATEAKESRSGDGAATSIPDDSPRNSQRGVSIVPGDETPVAVLHEGEISFVREDLVRLRYHDVPPPLATEVIFLITEETEILINGKVAGIEDLQRGMAVAITAEQHGDFFVARQIAVRPALV